MALPGFAAESSLYATRNQYRMTGALPCAEIDAGITTMGDASATLAARPRIAADHAVRSHGQAEETTVAAGALPRLNISDVYVTGASSGGYMATQLQVAYSDAFQGAGIFTAGPYYCGSGDLAAIAAECGSVPLPTSLAQSEADAAKFSALGLIDPISNLAHRNIYVYHGLADEVVSAPVADEGAEFYEHFGANVQYNSTSLAGHSWVSPLGPVECSLTFPPFINNCGNDPEGEMLTHWFGSVNPPNNGTLGGTLSEFSQSAYVPGGSDPATISLGPTGLLYTPASCAAGASCKLIVALHGCLTSQDLIGDTFANDSYLNQYADTNNLVILYPQAQTALVPLNPQGCWDWFGYTGPGPGYAVKGAPQMVTIMNMVNALGG